MTDKLISLSEALALLENARRSEFTHRSYAKAVAYENARGLLLSLPSYGEPTFIKGVCDWHYFAHLKNEFEYTIRFLTRTKTFNTCQNWQPEQ